MIKNLSIAIGGVLLLGIAYMVSVQTLHAPGAPSTPESTVVPEKTTASTGTIRVTALQGPTCPVERNPPDPACADKPYVNDFVLTKDTESWNVRTDERGTFSIDVPAGTYTVSSISARAYPRCERATVTVRAGVTTDTTISCDTGIR